MPLPPNLPLRCTGGEGERHSLAGFRASSRVLASVNCAISQVFLQPCCPVPHSTPSALPSSRFLSPHYPHRSHPSIHLVYGRCLLLRPRFLKRTNKKRVALLTTATTIREEYSRTSKYSFAPIKLVAFEQLYYCTGCTTKTAQHTYRVASPNTASPYRVLSPRE